MTGPRLLLTGATGMVGSAVLARGAARGAEVVLLGRRDPGHAAAARWIRGDLMEDAMFGGLPDAIDVVIHAAGAMHADSAANDAVNRDATLRLVEYARRAGARRFVYVSSTAVYGDGEQIETVENAPRVATFSYGRSKREAEDAVLEADATDFATCVVRPCPIVGRGAGHLLDGIRALVSQPTVPLPDRAARKVDVVDCRDVADLLVRLAFDRPDARGAFNAAAGSALSLREILAIAARSIGRTPHWQDVAIEVAERANAEAAARGEGPAVPPPLIAFCAVERTYSNARARDTGASFRAPAASVEHWLRV